MVSKMILNSDLGDWCVCVYVYIVYACGHTHGTNTSREDQFTVKHELSGLSGITAEVLCRLLDHRCVE